MKASVNLNLKEISSDEKEHLKKLFQLEDKNFNKRAKYEINENNNNLCFEIEAEDMVALRSCLNAITKTLSIYQRTKKLVEE